MLTALLACGLIFGVGMQGFNVSAQDEAPVLYDSIYFPFVPHGETINGTGPWYGSITVQNIETQIDTNAQYGGVRFWVFDSQTMNQIAMGAEMTVGQDDDQDDAGTNYRGQYSFADALEDPRVPRYDLDPNSSVTLSASDLGLRGSGSAVTIYAAYKQVLDNPRMWAGELGAPVIAGIQKQAMASPMILRRMDIATTPRLSRTQFGTRKGSLAGPIGTSSPGLSTRSGRIHSSFSGNDRELHNGMPP
jgi:hypothetical protein